MTNDEALMLIEFVRNRCSEMCQRVAVSHFTDGLAWENEGNVDPLEIAQARGSDVGATECRNEIQRMDCHAIFKEIHETDR